GIAMMRSIRNKMPDVAAILISAHLTEDVIVQANKLGFRYILNKPFDIEKLENSVKQVFIDADN
ncbi:response regulator, partial [candidate division KSB1 bacterium]